MMQQIDFLCFLLFRIYRFETGYKAAVLKHCSYVEFILKLSEFFTPFGELIDRRGKPS